MMREPTKDEMVQGIKEGVLAYLKDKDYGPSYERPLKRFEGALESFLSSIKQEIITKFGVSGAEELERFFSRNKADLIGKLGTRGAEEIEAFLARAKEELIGKLTTPSNQTVKTAGYSTLDADQTPEPGSCLLDKAEIDWLLQVLPGATAESDFQGSLLEKLRKAQG